MFVYVPQTAGTEKNMGCYNSECTPHNAGQGPCQEEITANRA